MKRKPSIRISRNAWLVFNEQAFFEDGYRVLTMLGEMSGCHRMPERSFFWHGKQFPVCARCTGAFVGYVFGAVVYPFFRVSVITAGLFCALMFLDWLVQRLDILPSTNLRRLITGLLCGFALMQLYLRFLLFFFRWILTLCGAS